MMAPMLTDDELDDRLREQFKSFDLPAVSVSAGRAVTAQRRLTSLRAFAWAGGIAVLIAVGLSVGFVAAHWNPNQATATATSGSTQTSGTVNPADFAPKVSVSPSAHLHAGQTVEVQIHSPFDVGFAVSECAAASDAGGKGCGLGSGQIFGHTGSSGSATVRFRVEPVASIDYRGPANASCNNRCVVVVSTDNSQFTSVPISFAPSSPVSQAPGACGGSQVTISWIGGAAALGHMGVILVFTNSSHATCILFASGQTPSAVHLAPGQAASARVEGTDNPEGTARSCPTYQDLLVTPPNTTKSTVVDTSLPGCSPLQVHPVVPGTTGDSPGR
jgi:hypothetical protein